MDNYNGQCNLCVCPRRSIPDHSSEMLKGIWNNKNLSVADECLYLFGNGDGGGGPTPMMLEKITRLSSLAAKSPEVPAIKIASPAAFFDALCRRTQSGATLADVAGRVVPRVSSRGACRILTPTD